MTFKTYELISVEITRKGPIPTARRFYADSAERAIRQYRQICDDLSERAVCLRVFPDGPWFFVEGAL